MDNSLLATMHGYLVTQVLRQPGRLLASDEKLISSGLIDSFSLVDLSIFIEDTFGVHIADTDLNADTFDSLSALAALIEQRRA